MSRSDNTRDAWEQWKVKAAHTDKTNGDILASLVSELRTVLKTVSFKRNDPRINEVHAAIEDLYDSVMSGGAHSGELVRISEALIKEFDQLFPEHNPLYPEEWKRSPAELLREIENKVRELETEVVKVSFGASEANTWVALLLDFQGEVHGRQDLSVKDRKKMEKELERLRRLYIEKFPLPWEGSSDLGDQPRLA